MPTLSLRRSAARFFETLVSGSGRMALAAALLMAVAATAPANEAPLPDPPTVESMSPREGSAYKGTYVTFIGTNLDTVTDVTVGGEFVWFEASSPTSLAALFPPLASGPGSVDVVLHYLGGDVTLTDAFEYMQYAPEIHDIAPSEGGTGGGARVRIYGANLTGATGVMFGTRPGDNVVVIDDYELQVTVPASVTGVGPVDVTVTGPGGTSAPYTFIYIAPPEAPTVSSVLPATAPTNTDSHVRVYGTNFTDLVDVTIDGTSVYFSRFSDTELEVRTDSHTAGLKTLTVTNTAGSASGSITFFNNTGPTPPYIYWLTQTEGSAEGGDIISIIGSDLLNVTSVKFGDTTFQSGEFDIIDEDQIQVTVPPGIANTTVAITATNTDGTSGALFYTYTVPPAPTPPYIGSTYPPTVSPSGEEVVVFGGNFEAAMILYVDGAPTLYDYEHNGRISFVMPAGQAGASVDIYLEHPTQGRSNTYTLSYNDGTVRVDYFDPASGDVGGGTPVMIYGQNLAAVTAVTFGGNSVVPIGSGSDWLEVETPAAASAGYVEVVLATSDGPVAASQRFRYIEVSPPVITSIEPNSGSVGVQHTIVINGENFIDIRGVTIDSEFLKYDLISSTQLTLHVKSGVPESATITVENAAGSASGIFTFEASVAGAPVIGWASVPVPGYLSPDGGTEVELYGSNFTGVIKVTLGGADLDPTSFNVVADNMITFTAPSGESGTAVSVTVANGPVVSNSVVLKYAWNISPVFEVDSASPSSGPTAGGTEVTFEGSGFLHVVAVSFNGFDAPIQTATDTELVVTTPAGAEGPATIEIVMDGGGSFRSASLFTYVAQESPIPRVTSLSETEGGVAGGETITITGSNFVDGATVMFGTVAASDVTFNSSTSISAQVPAHAAGSVGVRVTVDGAYSNDNVTYTYMNPVIASLSPASGGTAGGETVVITGQYLTGVDSVTFGGVTATLSPGAGGTDTEITVTTPAGASPGAVPVVATVTAYSAASNNDVEFTYDAPRPTITALSSSSGRVAGQTFIDITGTGFIAGATVKFGTVDSFSVTVYSSTGISALVPAHVAGQVGVTVTTSGGTSDSVSYTFLPPRIDSITPASGSASGGYSAVIAGEYLSGVNSVTFGGVSATISGVGTDTQVTVSVPAGTAGASASVVAAVGVLGTSNDTVSFAYNPLPTVVSLAPSAGPVGDATTVVITGTGLAGATEVKFGSDSGTILSLDSDTQITVETPASLPVGEAAVSVVTPNGTSVGGPIFTTYDAPDISSISPEEGAVAGGNAVTIQGSGFRNITAVRFGTESASFIVNSLTQITAVAPAGAVGPVDVTVENDAGSVDWSSYTYTAAALDPYVASVVPAEGPLAGGTPVVINGGYFTSPATVSFGGTPATGVVMSAAAISAVAPASPVAGPVQVTVTSGGFTTDEAVMFTYQPSPVITAVTPDKGPLAGTSVEISGTDLDVVTDVTFGGAPATITGQTATLLTVTAPAGTGTVDVAVAAPGGTDTKAAAFTYVPPPAVTSLTPASGSTLGGYDLVIAGSSFVDLVGVAIGGKPATVQSSSDNSITVAVPARDNPGDAGDASVVVETAYGSVTHSPFTYVLPAAPAVTGISPDSGAIGGGDVVTITGSGFTGAIGVNFNGEPGTGFTVVSDTEITVTAPQGATPGQVNVVVVGPGGTSNPTSFEYLSPAPVITGITPASGVIGAGAGVAITITGTGFTGATGVTFGGVAGIGFTVVSDTEITVTSPPRDTAGDVDVVVASPNGDSAAGTFSYLPPAPEVAGISTSSGSSLGGTRVVITGVNLAGATVTVGGAPATIVSNGDTEIVIDTPAGTAGAAIIAVTTPGGSLTVPGFSYNQAAAPTIASIDPAFGLTTGGTTITIIGTDLTGATVTIGGVPVPVVSGSDTELVLETPPTGASGPATIELFTALGDVTGVFSYHEPAVPVIDSAAPASGLPAGGNAVVLTGSGFTGVTSVMFGTVVAGFTIDSDTQITIASAPAGELGTVDIVATTSVGSSAGLPYSYEEDTRPDPSQDPDVRAIVASHINTAERFARVQMSSVHSRLSSLRRFRMTGQRVNDFRFNLQVSSPNLSRHERRAAYAQLNDSVYSVNAAQAFGDALRRPMQTRWSFWTDGGVTIGENDDDSGYDYTTYNIMLGSDYAFSDGVVAGFAGGYANDKTDIGNQGSKTSGHVFSAILYGSYSPTDSYYIEGLIGYGRLSLDSKRRTANGFADGDRDGNQFFGSVATGYDFKLGRLLLSPYGKFEIARSELDAYRERGGGNLALRFDKVTVETYAGSVGLKAEMPFHFNWGVLTPSAGMEYTHNFKGDTLARLGYTDQMDLPYSIRTRASARSTTTVSAGIDAMLRQKYRLGFEYRGSFSNNRDNHRFSLQAGWTW